MRCTPARGLHPAAHPGLFAAARTSLEARGDGFIDGPDPDAASFDAEPDATVTYKGEPLMLQRPQ